MLTTIFILRLLFILTLNSCQLSEEMVDILPWKRKKIGNQLRLKQPDIFKPHHPALITKGRNKTDKMSPLEGQLILQAISFDTRHTTRCFLSRKTWRGKTFAFVSVKLKRLLFLCEITRGRLSHLRCSLMQKKKEDNGEVRMRAEKKIERGKRDKLGVSVGVQSPVISPP